MSEPILLGILGLVTAIGLYLIRRWRAMSSRMDAVVRFSLMFTAALVAHTFFDTTKNIVWYILAVGWNAVFLYGASHFLDRVVTDGVGVLNKFTRRPS